MTPYSEALERLIKGNRRYATDYLDPSIDISPRRRRQLIEGQAPFAVVLGCSDSRVPAEIVFDQGLGELFVIRVAGNIVSQSQVGSVEFAVEGFGTQLVVVMGHTGCSAVRATLEELRSREPHASQNLRFITEHIRPAVAPLLDSAAPGDDAALAHAAVRANIAASAYQLRHGSTILAERIARRELLVVGAEYSLESGEVDFFDGATEYS
jgi:carbonic anhydrase